MTNEMIHAIAVGPAGRGFIDTTPLWPHATQLFWLQLILCLAAPAVSFSLCVRAWRLRPKGGHVRGTFKIILAAVLSVSTVTAVNVLLGLRDTFFTGATVEMDASSMLVLRQLTFAAVCDCLLIGVGAVSACAFCAVCLPRARSKIGAAYHASHATSESAPGADSSSHEG